MIAIVEAQVKAVTSRTEWRWIPDPAEAEQSRPQARFGSGSMWNDSVMRAMVWAKVHGTW